MKIVHWIRKEKSGLFRTAIELMKYEERAGHSVSGRTPAENQTFYGFTDDEFDIHCIHSQINTFYYKDKKPKILFLHGEPEYGMLNKVSIRAILDFAPMVDAFISFHEKESIIWNSFKRTYTIPKGIDLEKYFPQKLKKKLRGEPAILYAEHWRSFRHPLHVMIALEKAKKKLTRMRFYPFGCPPEDKEFWLRIIKQNKYQFFTPGVFKPQNHMGVLLNLSDIVVSPVYPSYGRVALEALACNKPVVAYNTNPHATYTCEPYNTDDMAEKIIQCWEEKPNSQRAYAEKYLSAQVMAQRAIEIYRRFV